MTFEEERARLLDLRYRVSLTEDQRRILRAGVFHWLGPARCSDEVARVIGYETEDEFLADVRRLVRALDEDEPMTGHDWRRLLVSTEINFGSDVLGCGVEWGTVTGFRDAETVFALREIQRVLVSVVRGQGTGDHDEVTLA